MTPPSRMARRWRWSRTTSTPWATSPAPASAAATTTPTCGRCWKSSSCARRAPTGWPGSAACCRASRRRRAQRSRSATAVRSRTSHFPALDSPPLSWVRNSCYEGAHFGSKGRYRMRGLKLLAGGLTLGAAALLSPLFAPAARAADHGDAPNVAGDQAADLADVYTFLDPNDNSKLIVAMTFRGFVVPGEAINFGTFDPNTLYRFEFKNTGDARADAVIEVSFSAKTATNQPQTATVRLPGRPRTTFTAPSTVPTVDPTPPTPTVTTDPTSGVAFFAGLVDDPFFFDLPAFGRFVASVVAGAPNPGVFSRGRDTFAGYNALCIALSMPRDLVRGAADNNVVGVNGVTLRRQVYSINRAGVARARGLAGQIDR